MRIDGSVADDELRAAAAAANGTNVDFEGGRQRGALCSQMHQLGGLETPVEQPA